MFNEIKKEIDWAGSKLTIETGKIARQSDGAVKVSMGDTVVLCAAVSAKETKDDAKFFPLTIHYREMAYAAGKIPGGFIKREGRASEREVLVSRLIDRPIRPLFHPGFFNETQVICTVLSHDSRYCSDILAMIGASAALALSGVPYMHIIGAAKVGRIDNEFVLNPSNENTQNSDLDLVVAATYDSIMMIESEVSELSEEQMLDAIKFAHNNIKPVIKLIEELKQEAGKPDWPIPDLGIEGLTEQINKLFGTKIEDAYKITNKQERYNLLKDILSEASEQFVETYGDLKLDIAFSQVQSRIVRHQIIKNKKRIDGRDPNQVRQIECETGILPRAHGSSLFTRGETQAIVASTLGTTQDEQMFESLEGDGRDRFMLHYIFPPYCVGETFPFRAPGRREIGHGKLAWRAINPVLPTKEEFPYTMRIVSEITESNGSSSMATVCGASMSLMDSGVPLKSPVSGIAMGLIKEGDDFVVLSDIMGDEDHLGDMDFKVAGTKDGITSLQMDIKVTGINYEIMQIALKQAKEGRIHILNKMNESIDSHRDSLSKYAPQIVTLSVNKEKIRDIIGPGGKVIKEICEISGAKVDINDDGYVQISAIGKEKIDIALKRINEITYEPVVGDILEGTVVKVLDSGAIKKIPGNKDGYLHISEISQRRLDSVSDELAMGDKIKVKIIGFDKGKLKLSKKVLEQGDNRNNSKNSDQNEDFEQNNSEEELNLDNGFNHSDTKQEANNDKREKSGRDNHKGTSHSRRRNFNDSSKNNSNRNERELSGVGKPQVTERKYFK